MKNVFYGPIPIIGYIDQSLVNTVVCQLLKFYHEIWKSVQQSTK